MPEPIDITAVLGSVTPPGRLCRAVSEALVRAAARDDVRAQLVDLADTRIAFADGRPLDVLEDDTPEVVGRIERADAVLFATPVYRGSVTGALKNLLDHVPVPALRDTPVAIVAMGGSDHHYLGVERHLRDVLSFFGAHPLPTAVYLTSRDFDDGVPGRRAAHELDGLLEALVVLTRALRGTPALGPTPLAARF
ncbi:MAG TPA: NAD(P)H-dependent oxidoreductase [Solirubrobacteraceae bacterium]